MSKLFFLNYFICQWFFFRIYKYSIGTKGSQVDDIHGYGVLFFVLPLTGWKNKYRSIGKIRIKHITEPK